MVILVQWPLHTVSGLCSLLVRLFIMLQEAKMETIHSFILDIHEEIHSRLIKCLI